MYHSILDNSKYYSIEAQCEALNISRNAFYNWKNNYEKVLEKRAKLLVKILEVYWDNHCIYGAPRITKVLNHMNIAVSQKTVSKYMRLLGITSIHTSHFPRKKSRLTAEERALIHNLILELEITKPNQVWTTDVTYIDTVYDGTLYLISYIDQFSKKVVGWYLGITQRSTDVEIALKDAIKKRKPLPGLICHSDKGSIFRSKLYRKLLAENHFIYSYTRLDHSCDDNAAQESFHATLKKEWLSTRTLYHYKDAYREIFKFIEGFYNPKRLHSSLGYVSPITFEKNYYLEQKMSKTPSE